MLLSSKDRNAITERLKLMQGSVRLVHFTQTLDCPSCPDAERLVSELEPLSSKLTLEVRNLHVDHVCAAQYGIERAPAMVIEGTVDYGFRLYGLPSGYEFAVLLETILLISSGRSKLDPKLSVALAPLRAPVHLQVFSTPTCPYCPAMALLAAQLAIESELVRADLYDATEFPVLVRAHNIRSVPKTVINGRVALEGAVPGHLMVEAILRAALPQNTNSLNPSLEKKL